MTIGASELARVLKISRERVYQLTRNGKISRAKDGKYDVNEVRQALRNNIDARQPAARVYDPVTFPGVDAPLGVQSPTLANVQLQHEIAKAATAQLQLKKLKGAYVLSEDVKREWGEHISAVRSRILLVPGKIAPRVAVETDVLACQEILEREINSVLTELSEYQPSA
jgi:hypothetical protein